MKIKVKTSVDVDKGTWGISDKRRKKNIDNFFSFFSGTNKWGVKNQEALEYFDADTIVHLLRLYRTHPEALETIFAYSRKYKQASEEITSNDVNEALKMLVVSDVMKA